MRQLCCKNNTNPLFGSGDGRASVVLKHGHNNHYVQLFLSKWQFLGATALCHCTGQANTAHNAPKLPTIDFEGVGRVSVSPCPLSRLVGPLRASQQIGRPCLVAVPGASGTNPQNPTWGGVGFSGGRDPSNIFQFPP